MNNETTKLRFTTANLQVREAEDGQESRTIEGCAIVCDQETTLYDGKYYRLRETIAPSCIDPAFIASQDIKLNMYHNREKSLCRRTADGKGTLQIEVRGKELWFRAEMPKCDSGNEALELVRNRTITGCSFEFIPDQFDKQNTTLPDGREDEFVKHTKFRSLSALTLALDPAYKQTSVGEREEYEQKDTQCREAQEAAQAEAQQREAAAKAEAEAAAAKREQQRIQNEITLILMEEDNQ